MARLVETFGSPEASVYTFGTDMVVVTVRTAITVDMLRASVSAGRKLTAMRGQPIAALTIIETGAAVPGSDLRSELTRTVEESRKYTLCAAQVLRGHGFWLSAVRSLLTALAMLTPGEPRRVFENPAPAARWIGPYLKRDTVWAEQVAQALRSVTRPTQEFMSAE